MPVPQIIESPTPADYLEAMTKVAFQSGLSWRVIAAKWDGFVEAFDGFSPETVADFTPDRIDALAVDPRIIRNRRKIEATVYNAGEIAELEHNGGFRSWLRSHDGYEAQSKAVRKRFKFIGEQGIRYFLYVVGEDVPPHQEEPA